MSLHDCPDVSLLRQLFDGTPLSDAAMPWTGEFLEAHINECPACQQSLERLAAGQQSWEGMAQQLAQLDGSPSAETPAIKNLIEEEKGRPPETLGGAYSTDSSLASIPLDFLQPSDFPESRGRIGSYEVLETVGRGGMGIVLRAYDSSLRRIVAIKVMAGHLASSPLARQRFVREARAAAAVSHDHVVAIYAVEDKQDPPFLVMQFIRGRTLQERLTTAGPLAVNEVLRIGMQTAAGLAAAHAQGLVPV